MAAVIQSFNTTAIASAATVVVTKPTGLAVGDLMVAHLYHSVQTITGLAGFTELINNSDGSDISGKILYKIADSSDVAASDFTFNVQ
jgi:hypothetical protein